MSDTLYIAVSNIRVEPEHLRILWQDGRESLYPVCWLRDNCPEDHDPNNGQRLTDIADQPEAPRIVSVEAGADRILVVHWAGEAKSSHFDLEWLREYSDWTERSLQRPASVLWDAAQTDALVWMDYAEVVASKAVCGQWLRGLVEYGLAFLCGVPIEAGKVLEVAELLGYVRETNYGRLFDVRSKPNPDNLAYTDLRLELHTDNPYRDPTPGLQLLHCLQAGESGGESLFLDGFAAAAHLRANAPAAFDVLTRTPVPFVFRSADTELSAEKPLIQVDGRGDLEAIHYNNRSIAPLRLPPDAMTTFYAAYRTFARLLRDSQFVYQVGLHNGDLVAFDNRRVLHGREALVAGGPLRHLQGCYVDRDGLLSRLMVLERT